MVITLKQEVLEQFQQFLPENRLLQQESMARHTTFRVGGPATLYAELISEEEMSKALHILQEQKEDYYLIGNGSNLLVSDSGYPGVILHFAKEYSQVQVEGNRVICQSGASLAVVARAALEAGLTGFAFAAGIPGSIGGAIVMNAGAYGGEMKQVVESVRLMDAQGNIVVKTCEEMDFSYRHSILKDTFYVVLSVTLCLQPGDKEQIKQEMDTLAMQRREKQPLEYPSAGSTFKRPEGYFAAKLIQDAGLRGLAVGDAQVSEKHCGFVVNKGNATATEIYQLMQEIIARVEKDAQVTLEPEVILLGEFCK